MRRLMYITFMLTILVLLSSCMKTTHVQQVRAVDTSFIAYLNEFKAQANSRGVNVDDEHIVVLFGNVKWNGKNVVASCSYDYKGPTVTVDANEWNNVNDLYREEILFHELGHCLLGLDHDNGKEDWINYNTGKQLQDWTVPRSIMNAVILDGGLYQENRQVFLDGLFLSSYNGVDAILYVGAPSQFNWMLYR